MERIEKFPTSILQCSGFESVLKWASKMPKIQPDKMDLFELRYSMLK